MRSSSYIDNVCCQCEDLRQRNWANPTLKAVGFAIVATIAALCPACGGREVPNDTPEMDAASGADRMLASEASDCRILASTYDQSCSLDTDCLAVDEVHACPATICSFCTTGVINRQVASTYMKAFSSATAAVPLDAGSCNCGAIGNPCCRAGVCQFLCN
jgi:hypothetical protein